MPLRLEIKRLLSNRSERVKAVDFHPTEPWLLTALYNGNVHIWHTETQQVIKSFEVAPDLPVRAAKFIARKSWIVAGSDDMQVRVFNYNTHEKVLLAPANYYQVIAFDAHADYIRSIAVHHTQPFLLTSSDDMLIKLWDWEKGWKNVMVFEGHSHYVMQVVFNPKDNNTFASACLDRTVKVWSLGSSNANYTLEGHEKGVNCVDYYYGNDKPYLISGADDKLVKVWDYQNKTCVQTLEGHTQNVTVLCYHPELPIIISGSEDGTVRIWHSNTYRLENTLNYGMERVWAVGYIKGSNDVAFGYDEGIIAVKLGREEPAISMDNSGKIIWAKQSMIYTANVKTTVVDDDSIKDGEKLILPNKDLGSCEMYPQMLQHSPNGRFVVVCGDGEYIIYTALAWRNKSFGSALEFVWALDSNEYVYTILSYPLYRYAARDSSSRVKLFKNFKEKSPISTSYSAEGIFGGSLLGIKSSSFLVFYDWETGGCVRRIDVVAKNVFWSESDLVVIAGEDSFYVLKFIRQEYQQVVDQVGAHAIPEDGIEEAFEFICEISEGVKTGCWVGDCFIYTNTVNRLNYVVGGQVSTISHFDKFMYLLGYIPRDNRIYLCDKDQSIYSYLLPVSVIEYQTAVLRGDMEAAEKILPSVPADQRNKIARFLESQDLKEEAMAVSTDLDHKFDLAIQLDKLQIAHEIAEKVNREDKWKTVGDNALAKWDFELSEKCLKKAEDLEGLLLMYQSTGNKLGMSELASLALRKGKNNVAFLCHLLIGEIERCLEILVASDRVAEATIMARTYLPTEVSRLTKLWKESLVRSGKQKMAEALADPIENSEQFPDYKYGVFAEAMFKANREKGMPPATDYQQWKDSMDWDIIKELKQRYPDGLNDVSVPAAAVPKKVVPQNGIPAVDDIGDDDLASHMSLEVNTTGTGSQRGANDDFDDVDEQGGGDDVDEQGGGWGE